ncbi:MAG TPA: methyltransferase domain-containing protein [Geminicoccus sp.]|jgi:SAM-dependent methyltransferase|uniref:methyltransferase domain-containing protein n=1 Tax=Geminicoccus sp. TaxID=2024832 RepID=UPI002E2F8BDD|nr:methyltransferase domain-containing protein [Geminicoccus sp.]HEX2526141.1 methyltransferase domain-containing protein [Geminicoccus sp.]
MTAIDFSRRATTPELMDTEDCDFATFRGCLRDLARVNRLTLAYRPTLSFLNALAEGGRLPAGRPLRILDVASGQGDMLRRIARWGGRRGLPLELTGLDLNPWAVASAREATPADLPIEWRTGNIFDFRPDRPVDLVISSLFTHHLDDVPLVRFLRWMEDEAALGWFVNDLHRHPLPYRLFARASRLMRLHRFVQNDGPISIARSFRAEDWRRYLTAAGLPEDAAAIGWWMPFRLCVARVRPA